MNADSHRDYRQCIVILALALIVAVGVPARAADEPTRILILLPGQLNNASIAHLDNATRASLHAALTGPLQIDSEAIDDFRKAGRTSQEEAFVELLLQRYGERPPHLIVAHAGAVLVVTRHRQKLWPGTPLIFAMIPPAMVEEAKLPSDVLMAFTEFDFVGTVDLALRLQPRARRALVMYGLAPFEEYWGSRAIRALDKFKDRIEVEAIVGATMEEQLELAKTAGLDTIILVIGISSDRAGRAYMPSDVLRSLTAVSRAPVYTQYQNELGNGVVGGAIARREDDVGPIGELARRQLAGEPVSQIDNSPPPPSVCIVDWRRVAHWKLDAELIPRRCEIIFRDATFMQKYRNELVALVGSLVFILILSSGYFLQRKERRVAEREVLQRSEELAHATRLASAGQLTASITHEMNQPLTAILSNAEVGAMLAAREHPPLQEIREIFEEIRDADVRASSFIAQLRSLLTKRPIILEPLCINDVVSTTLRLLERAARSSDVTLAIALHDGLPEIAGDRVHLQQVLLNLIMNAMEAVAQNPPDRRRILVHTELADNEVVVGVRDLGPGITPEGVKKLFEPFYTTKPHGMGLGLSLVKTIVEAHEGRIWVDSGKSGTTFRFTIPLAQQSREGVAE